MTPEWEKDAWEAELAWRKHHPEEEPDQDQVSEAEFFYACEVGYFEPSAGPEHAELNDSEPPF